MLLEKVIFMPQSNISQNAPAQTEILIRKSRELK